MRKEGSSTKMKEEGREEGVEVGVIRRPAPRDVKLTCASVVCAITGGI